MKSLVCTIEDAFDFLQNLIYLSLILFIGQIGIVCNEEEVEITMLWITALISSFYIRHLLQLSAVQA
jgi:hypothetical protein